jgi:hypothetical protein
MKAPSLISDDEKKKSDADLATAITGTAKHPAPVKGLSADDVKGDRYLHSYAAEVRIDSSLSMSVSLCASPLSQTRGQRPRKALGKYEDVRLNSADGAENRRSEPSRKRFFPPFAFPQRTVPPGPGHQSPDPVLFSSRIVKNVLYGSQVHSVQRTLPARYSTFHGTEVPLGSNEEQFP